MPRSDAHIAVAAALLVSAASAQTTRPERVVSINLCTDQLAMMLADEGQLLSVSYIALDPLTSAMVEEAGKYDINYGLAEEIYLMEPDLVLAGTWSSPATLGMLERLGIPVALFDSANTLEEVDDKILQMGEVLGRQEVAAEMAEAYNSRLASFRAEVADRPRAALYYANGYTLGDSSLAGQILLAAGFDNVAAEVGMPYGGTMPLEVLALSNPDAILTSEPYPGASRSESILQHPVVTGLRDRLADAAVTDRDWVCGTPFVLDAIERTAEMRRAVEEARP